MITNCFAVFDSKAKAFGVPFYALNVAVAVRSFAQAANDPALSLCTHAEDFTLFHLGRWDDISGVHELFPQFVNLGLAAQFKGVNRDEPSRLFKSVGDEASVQRGAEGRDSAKHV